MVQFKCPRVIYPLVSFTFGSTVGCPFPLHAGKGECCMWPVDEVELYMPKISSMGCKWSNLNAPGSYFPRCHSLLGPLWVVPFLCMQEKGNAAWGLLIKWQFILQKQISLTAIDPIWMPQSQEKGNAGVSMVQRFRVDQIRIYSNIRIK